MADVNVNVPGQGLTPFAFEQLTVSTTLVNFTTATWQPSGEAPAKAALVQVESQPCRYRGDGTAPAAAVGHLLAATDTIVIPSSEACALAGFIRSGGSDATLNVTFYR